jgi:hypothetical protein
MPNDDKLVNKKMMRHLAHIHKNAPLRGKSSRIRNKLYKISDTYLGPNSISSIDQGLARRYSGGLAC